MSFIRKLIYFILTPLETFRCRRLLAGLTPEQLDTVIRRVRDFPDDFLEEKTSEPEKGGPA